MAAALILGNLMTIEPKKNYSRRDWKEDIFRMMKKAAFENKLVIFLFDD